MEAIVLDDPVDVAAALAHPALDPPRVDGVGSTLAFRAAMARFSSTDEHSVRRAAVVAAIDRLEAARAATTAAERTTALLNGRALDVMMRIAPRVPTETLATLLGVGDGFEAIVSDVESVVRVIGRGEPASAASDAATQRLRDRFGNHDLGWVPVASILYQGFDATMWLTAVTLHARAVGRPAIAAVPRTRRIAGRDAIVGGVALRQGADVVLEIGAAGLPFGAGAHRCPGTDIAEAVVAGIVDAIEAAGYSVDLDGVTVDGDGRPTSLPIVPDTVAT